MGHTHDHVDQLFSIITEQIHGRELRCLEDLVQAVSTSPMKPNPTVIILHHICDFKEFITPKMDANELAKHSFYHCFKITKEDSITRLRAKPLLASKTFVKRQNFTELSNCAPNQSQPSKFETLLIKAKLVASIKNI